MIEEYDDAIIEIKVFEDRSVEVKLILEGIPIKKFKANRFNLNIENKLIDYPPVEYISVKEDR